MLNETTADVLTEDASTGVPPHADRIHQRPPFRNERDAGTVKPLQDLDEVSCWSLTLCTFFAEVTLALSLPIGHVCCRRNPHQQDLPDRLHHS